MPWATITFNKLATFFTRMSLGETRKSMVAATVQRALMIVFHLCLTLNMHKTFFISIGQIGASAQIAPSLHHHLRFAIFFFLNLGSFFICFFFFSFTTSWGIYCCSYAASKRWQMMYNFTKYSHKAFCMS